jgi:tetratricopeptide (TPR) repeat protein
MYLHPLAAGLLGAALLSSSALADSYLLRNGSELRGTVSSTTEDRMTIRLDAPAGAIATFTRDQVEPHSWYVARSQTIGDDANARLDLARYCVANGLFFAAERQLDRVTVASTDLAPAATKLRAEAREAGARRLIELAREAIVKNDLAHAASLAATVSRRYEETAAAPDALVIVNDIAQRRSELEQARIAESQRRAGEQKAQALIATLKEFVARMEQARRQNVTGLRTKDLSGAQSAFNGAARKFVAVIADVDARADKTDDELAARLREVRADAVTEAIEAHVNMGSLYLVRGSFTTAEQHANEALALDPKSAYAREFRARVELAAGEASGNRGRARRVR